MNVNQRLATGLAFLVLVIAAAVYFVTLTPTVPFWDSGEFIAVSYILGVPHPPGTPFFVLIGRIAALTLVSWPTVAQRVNAVSAIAGALTVLLTYLSILRLARTAQGGERQPHHEWIALAGAAVGALMLAFSDCFWENSIEAEVYQLMSLAQILVFWLGLKWWEAHDRKPTVGPLLLAVYVMWLCVGLHLGVGVMGAPLIALVFLVDRRVAFLFAMPFLSLLRVPAGLEKMGGTVVLLSFVYFGAMAYQKRLNGWVVAAATLAALPGLRASFTDKNFEMWTLVLTVVSLAVPLVLLAWKTREGRIMALSLFLMFAGYSNHLYLPIRAAQHPAVNEGAPATWDRMRDLLERKQYGEMNMFKRRAPLAAQLDKEFWRYFKRQWPVLPRMQPFEDFAARLPSNDYWGRVLRLLLDPMMWYSLIPLLLGIAGAIWQSTRDRKGFALNFVFFGLNTAGLIVFLNFTDHEVRDRDYFFQSGYHAFAMWIGLGLVWLIGEIAERMKDEGTRRNAVIGASAAAALLPLLLARNLWFTHDRSGNYIARDYAYNMLAPLAPNSYVFTNGDNDTFPLWYIQQVEKVRTDVRVVNLSLLNTEWYIKQLRDDEPKVPIDLDDAFIDRCLSDGALRVPMPPDSNFIKTYLTGLLEEGCYLSNEGYVIQPDGRTPVFTNEFVVRRLIQRSRANGGWKKQPYFAVTVPEHYGFDPYFSLEGLVYNVKTDSLQAGVNVEATENALYKTFRYRGLFNPDGSWNSKVFKDDNAATLSKNYAAAHLQLAVHYRREGKLDTAIAELERIERMFPDYTEVLVPLGSFYLENGDTAKAMSLFERLASRNPGNAEARYFYGASLAYRGRLDEAIQQFEIAMQIDPNYGNPYYAAYTTLWDRGQRERALSYLKRWVDLHPDDNQARQLYEAGRAQMGLGITPAPAPLVRPPALNLP